MIARVKVILISQSLASNYTKSATASQTIKYKNLFNPFRPLIKDHCLDEYIIILEISCV